MSNQVYPSLPGLMWDWTRTPVWSTTEKKSVSGRSFRTANYSYPLYQIKLAYEVLRSAGAYAEMAQLVGFYNQMNGAFDTFLWVDPDDNTIANQGFGAGDGSTTQFQLVRAVGGYVEPVSALSVPPYILVAGACANNFVAGGSFEVDTNADGLADGMSAYSAGTTGAITYSRPTAGGAPAGTYRQRVNAANLGTGAGDRAGFSTSISVVALAGFPATVSGYIAADVSGSPNARLHVDFFDGVGGYITSMGSTFTPSPAGFTRFQATAPVPANAVGANVYVWVTQRTGSPGAAAIEVDGLQFEYGSVAQDYGNNLGLVLPGSGLCTFRTAPGVGQSLVWSGSYYRRMRFTQDSAEFSKLASGLWEIRSVEMESVKL